MIFQTDTIVVAEPVNAEKVEQEEEEEEITDSISQEDIKSDTSILANKSVTLPPKLDIKTIDWDELDDLLLVCI